MQTACPQCSQIYPVPDYAQSKTARCKKCGHSFKVEPFVEIDLKEELPESANRGIAKKSKENQFVIAFGLIVLILLAWVYWGLDDQPRQLSHSPDSAYVMAQNFVEDQLKSPSSAQFPVQSQANIRHLGNGRYVVTAWVNSENAFGATLRNRFTCKLHTDDGNRWKCTSLVFDR